MAERDEKFRQLMIFSKLNPSLRDSPEVHTSVVQGISGTVWYLR